MRRTRYWCPAARPRWPRFCGSVPIGVSRWCRSAAAPVWSADWTRCAATSRPWCRWTCAGSTNYIRSTRCPGRPNWAPGSPAPRPSDCSPNAVSHSAISLRASASPPSAASPPRGPPGRIPPVTADSTTWSAACAQSPRRVFSTSDARRSPRRARTCVSFSWARKAHSGSSRGCGSACIPCRSPPATKRGRSPISPPAPTRSARWCRQAPARP
jgi:hypothetical protein